MNLTASGTLTESTIMGGRIPRVAFDATLSDDTAQVNVDGSFADFDPSAVSGKPAIKGTVGGSVRANATVAGVSKGITPESVQATINANLDSSTVGGLAISNAALDADYRDSSGEIRTLEVVGRDLNVRASGTLALNDTGQSNLSIHADSPSLETIGKLVDQPLTGIAKIDATVTGNRSQMQAHGKVTADGVKYQGNGALTASSDFTASVSNLDPSTATADATTHATFVTLGGQNINELTATTQYTAKELDFDATARQPQRSLSAAGSLVFHPDHQEIHLRSLGLQSQGVQWQTAPDAHPALQYGGDAITVEDFRLVNGAQQISAAGTFGEPGEALVVTMKDIDVATVDALLLRPPQLSGRLNASANVSGTKAAPAVDATFAIDQGGFRQFRYDTFGGTVKYADKGVDLDARLQQGPTTWLTAKGYAPIANDAPRNQYDLHIDSSAVDLGLVQGFTSALTKVTGTLHAKVDIRGAAGDPRPEGAISIERAAFTVEPTGVEYTNLDGQLELQSDKIHIDEISVLDNHRSPLSISGDLPIREREIGALSIAIKANDFKVVDNKMGNVRINTDMRIAGQVNAPRIEGDLGITTGAVNLDPILAQVGTSAYATKETEFQTAASDAEGQTSAGSTFDALYAFVHLTVPNDLVIKSNNLQAPGSPIGLGSLNVTLGGDVTVHKAPYDQPRIYGTVNTIRGNYDFQGRRFEILRDGTVKFEGTDDIDPSLDLKTQRIIQAVTAQVNVRGTLKKPEIALSSVPPLEEADILSLIVFNQPINQLGEGQQTSLAARAQGLALGAAAGQLTQSIGSALNLDTLELNMTPENGGSPELTVGEQIGQNLFVKIQQGIGDQSQTNFILEYELTKWLRFRTNVLQGSSTSAQLFQRVQGSGADLLFFFSY
jgi:autotransporter translocation and assembly factor TamB